MIDAEFRGGALEPQPRSRGGGPKSPDLAAAGCRSRCVTRAGDPAGPQVHAGLRAPDDGAARDRSLASSVAGIASADARQQPSERASLRTVLVLVMVLRQSWPPGDVRLAVQGSREQPHLSCALHRRGTVLRLELRVDVADVGEALALVAELLAQNKLVITVQTFPFERAAEAYRISQGGHVRGKLVLVP